MNLKILLILLPLIALEFASGCSHQDSPSDVQNKASMIAHSWAGDKFFTFLSGDTMRVAKECVVLMGFKTDGRFQLIYAIDSGSGKWGKWNLEEDGKIIRLSCDSLHSGVFSIVELSSLRFVFGDTNSYGYSLIPRAEWDGMANQ